MKPGSKRFHSDAAHHDETRPGARSVRSLHYGNQHPAHVLAAHAFECEKVCAEVFDQLNDVPVEFDDLAVEVENSSSSSPSSFTKLML